MDDAPQAEDLDGNLDGNVEAGSLDRDDLDREVGVLKRREIEARVLRPFFEAVKARLGETEAKAMLARVIVEVAKAAGRSMRRGGDADLRDFADAWEPWFRGGALEVVEHERDADVWRFDVVRCRYAELYRSLGIADLGSTLSCARDAALIEGYDTAVSFERTTTLMEGAERCDFVYRRKRAEPPSDAP